LARKQDKRFSRKLYTNMPIKDKSKYPSNWFTEIRPAILKRANNCCEVCKAKNKTAVFRGFRQGLEIYQTIDGNIYRTDNGDFLVCDPYECIEPSTGNPNQKAILIVLTIAHLNHDTTNNDYSNLKAMCQLHHLRHDLEHHKANAAETRNKKKRLQSLF